MPGATGAGWNEGLRLGPSTRTRCRGGDPKRRGDLNFFTRNTMKHFATLPVLSSSRAWASIRSQATLPDPDPDPELVSPLTPDDRPSLLHPPRQVPPQIRQPDRPGEHMPISADPRLSPSTRPRRLGACHD